MEELQRWLTSHGLGDFFETLAEERIRVVDLPDFTEADLRELGMPMGPRKQLLRAALAINTAPDAQSPTGTGAPLADPEVGAERRRLTAMFCDLMDSTELAEISELEAYRFILSAIKRAFELRSTNLVGTSRDIWAPDS